MAKLVYDENGRLLFTKEMKQEYTILMPQMLPIHFGMFMCLTLCLGGLTPPVGLCLITPSRIVDVDIDKMFPDLLWCIGIYVLVIALVAVFPGLATWLPSMMA